MSKTLSKEALSMIAGFQKPPCQGPKAKTKLQLGPSI